MATKSYLVKGIDLIHDEQRYPEGERIDLDDNDAKALRRWLEPLPLALQDKATKQAESDDKKSADGQKAADKGGAGDGTDKGQSTDKGEGDKQ